MERKQLCSEKGPTEIVGPTNALGSTSRQRLNDPLWEWARMFNDPDRAAAVWNNDRDEWPEPDEDDMQRIDEETGRSLI